VTSPQGWVEISLEEVGRWGSGGTPKASESSYYGGSIPWVRSGDLPDGPMTAHEATISEAGLANSSAKWVQEGAVLIAMYGATIGKLGITSYPVTTNQAIAFIEPSDGIEVRYLFENLRYRKPDLVALGQGGAQPNISQEILKAQTFPLPPLAEQRRIVAKLDALTARLARARAELDRVPVLADQLRTQVLKDAFAGRTPSSHVPFAHWLTLPAAEACGKVQSGGTPKAGFAAEGVPFLKVYNIVGQKVAFDYKPQYVTAAVHGTELRKSMAQPGDVLMNIVGPPLGKVAIVPDQLGECNFNQALTMFRPSDLVTSYWLYYFLCSGRSVASVVGETRGIAGQVNISLSQCRAFEIPIPPLSEQDPIVSDIEAAFARADRLEAEATRARTLLDRLESALLAKAFRGELVPQDPNDEPAQVLLERVRAQRLVAPKARRGRKAKVAA
jgi:type I restriction enzyme S subunit